MLIRTAIVTLLLAVVAACFFGYVLHSQSGTFREFQTVLLSLQWMLLVCLAVWCGVFIFLTFSLKDLPLIGILLIAIAVYFIGEAASWRITDAIILLASVTLGRGARFALEADGRWNIEDGGNNSEIVNQPVAPKRSEGGKSAIVNFLVGLAGLLAFSAWWHLDMSANFYHGPRWMGLWNNPNDYGMLMGAGLVLAIGLLAGERSRPGCRSTRPASNTGNANDGASLTTRGARVLPIILFIAAGMMGVGLLFSYSRGAWVGTAMGLLYLAKSHGKFKWRFVLPGILVVAAVVFCFWHSTADTGSWYLKRMDLSRPSAQHRVAAWRGAVQMMWDHPFGVGWNKAIETYDKNYSPPEGGAAAITTNDYLMLGTQLGFPGLLCFVAYVGLCFKNNRRSAVVSTASCGGVSPPAEKPGGTPGEPAGETPVLRCACRAGALAMLVAFWFDGGLFKLATASVFWILLELGSAKLEPPKVVPIPAPA